MKSCLWGVPDPSLERQVFAPLASECGQMDLQMKLSRVWMIDFENHSSRVSVTPTDSRCSRGIGDLQSILLGSPGGGFAFRQIRVHLFGVGLNAQQFHAALGRVTNNQ